MSKIGRVNLELQEQANELGFSTVQEALDNGYEVDYENETLKDPQEAAHEAWLKEREEVIKGLVDCYKHLHGFPPEVYDKILRAIEFIKKGEV